MLLSYITYVIMVSGVCLGIRAASEPLMILHSVREYLTSKLGVIAQPILGCVKCMASFWGLLVCFYVSLFDGSITMNEIMMWPLAIISSVFVNGMLFSLYRYYNPE